MANLKHTTIYRGGVTASHLTIETHNCSFRANVHENALDLRFRLASKGGGTTEVLLRIGIEDLPAILTALATSMPENAGVLADCAALANRRNLELLNEARKHQQDREEKPERVTEQNEEKIERLLEQLKTVKNYIDKKYYEAPDNEEERVAAVRDELEDVLTSLWHF